VLYFGHLLLPVLVDKELVVQLLEVLLKLFVLGDRPLPPVFMGRGLQLGVLHLMLLPLVLLLPLWELGLPGLAHALLLVLVLVGANMRLVVALLQVLVCDWLLLQALVGTGLILVLQRLVLGGKGMLPVGRDLRLLILARVLLLICGTL
jgi:hypothetical protein